MYKDQTSRHEKHNARRESAVKYEEQQSKIKIAALEKVSSNLEIKLKKLQKEAATRGRSFKV